MCGVPVHSAESYFLTLIRKGFRVAVCEQMEDPAEAKKRGSKSVVRREVVRLVTPGTLTEDTLLQARHHNYLAAFAEIRGEASLAWTDISTGAFHVMACPLVRLGPELARLAPQEILVADGAEAALPVIEEAGIAMTPLAPSSFDSGSAARRIEASLFQECNRSTPSALSRAPTLPPWARSSTTWRSRKRASCRSCARRSRCRPGASCRSTRPRGATWN